MSQADGVRNINGLKQQQLRRVSSGSGLPEDLLHGYMSGNPFNLKLQEETAEEGDIELSLGLSLNGRFGVDPRAKKLTRSSSIPDFIDPTRENGSASVGHVTSTNIGRTCSLPAETQEQWRKRKEMQTQRRMEVKRKRLEKKGSLKRAKDMNEGYGEENGEEGKRENGNSGNHHKKEFKNFNGGFNGAALEALVPQAEAAAPLSQGSIGSQGSGSSGITDSESQHFQGMVKCSEARSPVIAQSLTECEQKFMLPPRASVREESGSPAGARVGSQRSDKPSIAKNRKEEEMVREVLEDMPCVSTKGDGPNGKRIEGFLYRYRKGEQVRIVCVCHGSFLSPAEFVKHAGGGDVAQPLKHIVVSPSPLL